jgi:regulator of RNase E activity RraB
MSQNLSSIQTSYATVHYDGNKYYYRNNIDHDNDDNDDDDDSDKSKYKYGK